MKDLQKLSKFHNMFIKWFPFLTVLWGKGGLMIFAGSLGAAFFSKLVMFVPCMVTIAIGVINMLMYFGKMEQYDKAYDKSMKMATQMYTEYAPVAQRHDDAAQRGYDFSAPHQHHSKPHSKPQPHSQPQYQSKFSDTSGSY
ncbi:MAG: uncharacterized protein KVP18_003897 [Porospora cf. gigantea A]|uniref:uncharacterized protein n=1 Tax=Porospora cf. gigantea A TaxID=2853593 RepID=UPI00355A8BBA|nr:MAG: hypothetical protein KVP18_003897 [Porospora cf. gigantea A]